MSGSVAAATSGANATGSGGASQVGGSATGGSAIGSGGASQTGGASAAGGTADAPGNGGDAGTAGASGDPGSAAFDVTALPGLTLWLDATLGVRMGSGTTIVAWTDQSASKRQFAASPHAGTISLDAIGVNGHPALKIDGGADFYPAAGSVTGFDWASDDFLVEAVTVATGTHRFFNAYEGNAVSQSDLLIDYDTGTPSGGIVNQSGLPVLVSAASASSGAHVVGLQYTQAAAFTLDLRLDGKVLATEMSSPPNIHANSVEVGYALGTGTLEVAEIIVLHGTTSVANRAAIENYLATRYGL